MGYLAEYKKQDFKKVSWDEYGKTLGILHKKVSKYLKENNIKIDAVVPILRGGAFPGTYLAFKLNLLRMLPVQYKYFFIGKKIELRKILDLPRTNLNLPKKPTFLLVENNHCFGLTNSSAAKDLKKKFPHCKIISAIDHMDYSYQKVECAEKIFYGRLTNETRALTKKACKEKGIENISYLFPWEKLDEEWITIKGHQFKYGDLKSALKSSKLKIKIDN